MFGFYASDLIAPHMRALSSAQQGAGSENNNSRGTLAPEPGRGSWGGGGGGGV